MKRAAALLFLLALGCVSAAAEETQITLHAGDVIVAEGDSLTYGADGSPSGVTLATPFNGSLNPRSTAPYPETLQKILGDKLTVINHGFPGDRTTEGLDRWKNAKGGNVTLIMYGTNDRWNFGGYPSGSLSVDAFKKSLTEIVTRRKKEGTKIILLTPPPLPHLSQEEGMIPYREAVRAVAQEQSSMLEDTAEDLKSVTNIWCDGLHLSVEANQRIAAALAKKLVIRN